MSSNARGALTRPRAHGPCRLCAALLICCDLGSLIRMLCLLSRVAPLAFLKKYGCDPPRVGQQVHSSGLDPRTPAHSDLMIDCTQRERAPAGPPAAAERSRSAWCRFSRTLRRIVLASGAESRERSHCTARPAARCCHDGGPATRATWAQGVSTRDIVRTTWRRSSAGSEVGLCSFLARAIPSVTASTCGHLRLHRTRLG